MARKTTATLDVSAAERALVDAENDAKAAEELLASLEQQVIEGNDDVTPDQIETQSGLVRFAKLRIESMRRKAASAKEEARRAQCQALREEMDAFGESSAEHLRSLLADVKEASTAFVEAVAEREGQLTRWRTRMQELNVPPMHRSPENSMLGHRQNELLAGTRVFPHLHHPSRYLAAAITPALTASPSNLPMEAPLSDHEAVLDSLRNLDALPDED